LINLNDVGVTDGVTSSILLLSQCCVYDMDIPDAFLLIREFSPSALWYYEPFIFDQSYTPKLLNSHAMGNHEKCFLCSLRCLWTFSIFEVSGLRSHGAHRYFRHWLNLVALVYMDSFDFIPYAIAVSDMNIIVNVLQ